jgi:ATP-binding cassette subfamily B protein
LIVVAHRLQTVMNADKIVVIEDGNIAGEGKHALLLETCAAYQKMWQSYIQTEGRA